MMTNITTKPSALALAGDAQGYRAGRMAWSELYGKPIADEVVGFHDKIRLAKDGRDTVVVSFFVNQSELIAVVKVLKRLLELR